MLEDAKTAIRIDGDDSDIEVQDLIYAAKADLQLSGVHSTKIVDTDPLIKRAIILYCKANFGHEDPKLTERFQQSYISLKNHLALSSEYTEVVMP